LPYPYKYTEKDQIYVLEGTTELTREQDFTVSYDGSVTLLKDIPAGTVLTIYRSTPLDQGSEFPQEAPFSSKKIEDALDKLTMQNQEQREALSRALKLPMTASTDLTDLEMPTPEPNRSVKWNAEGTALVNTSFDPDTALVQTENFKKEAEQAAKDAVAAKDSITITSETLVSTANQATEEIRELSEETQETINTAVKHKLNSKEIGSLLKSPIPQNNSDLNLADGSTISSEHPNYSELHTSYLTQKRNQTDIVTSYYKYNSYNYSREWYSTVPSSPDKFYGLTGIINAPAGTWYLFDRTGTPVLKPSIEVKTYYKYELINAVGDTAPHQYLLWQVFADDKQLAEPTVEHIDEFYAFVDDYRVGAKINKVSNILVLPPDITSEYRRIQITRVDGNYTYYYYYKATPVEIHAFMDGTVVDLTLNGTVGAQTIDTVIRPYLCTTHKGTLDKVTNKSFLDTASFDNKVKTDEDYNQFYTALSNDTTYEIEYIHDEVNREGAEPRNIRFNGGLVSGFTTASWLSTKSELPRHTTFEGEVVRTPIETFELGMRFKTSPIANGAATNEALIESKTFYQGMEIHMTGSTNTAGTASSPNTASTLFVRFGAGGSTWLSGFAASKEKLELNSWYTMKIVYTAKEYILQEDNSYVEYNESLGDKASLEITTRNMVQLYLAKKDEELEFQSEFEVPLDKFNTYIQESFVLGSEQGAIPWCGTFDLGNTYFKINDELCWGHKKIAYLKKDGHYLQYGEYNNYQPYHGELAPNLYETLPTGFVCSATSLGLSTDGWFTPSAATQFICQGTGVNTTVIDFRADDYLELKWKMFTGNNESSASNFNYIDFIKLKANYGPFLFYHKANVKTPVVWAGRQGDAWQISDVSTSLEFNEHSEYDMSFVCDFTKKYIKQTDEEGKESYVESSEETAQYLYKLSAKRWSIEEQEDIQEWSLLSSVRLGSGSNDLYRISGISWNSYVANVSPAINFFSIRVNGKPLFQPNITPVDRVHDASVLPKISEAESNLKTYVVCANGVTEDVCLTTTKTDINSYIANTIQPELQKYNSDTIAAMNKTYSTYNQTLTNTYKEGIKALTQASNSVTKNELVECYPVIQTYYNEGSWYRIYARDSVGYWCEQGGTYGDAYTSYVDKTITLLKEYRDISYIALTSSSNTGDLYYPSIMGKTPATLTIKNTHNYNGYGNWYACGYLLDSEVAE
jgi:hypothetical protein